MDSLNDILAGVSKEDLEKLKDVAASITGSNTVGAQTSPQPQTGDMLSSFFDGDTQKMLMKVMTQLNRESSKTQFIKALSPLLSEERRKKADEAARFLKLMDTLPLLKGMLG